MASHARFKGRAVAALQRRMWRVVRSEFRRRQSRDGLSQAELSRLVGVSRSQIHVWLHRPDQMTLKAAARLLSAMGADLHISVVDRRSTVVD